MVRTKVGICAAIVVASLCSAWYLLARPEMPRSDIVYRTVDGQSLTVDLEYPKTGRRGSLPVVILAPPEGDWESDIKKESRYRIAIESLNSRGYVVAIGHYRQFTKYPFPASIDDGKTLVRWLRANASTYGLDAEKIGVIGASCGGYGACMLGSTDAKDGFEGDELAEYSSRVQAVVALGAPVDLAHKTWTDYAESMVLKPYLGVRYSENPEAYRRASPGTYATADDPPVMLVHSQDDLLISIQHSRRYAEQLRAKGVRVKLREVDGLPHVWDGDEFRATVEEIAEFLDEHLK